MPIEPTKQQNYATPPPVTPRPKFLPLSDPNFSPDDFEAFCEALIFCLPDVKNVHRFGGRGSPQRGIDIYADFENGERWGFQCKQRKRFTKTDATRAIQQTSFKADRFILMLSRQATSGVRDTCESHPIWDVWDVVDISRKVRELQMHKAAKLVEVHFGPWWRKAFLGLPGLFSFITPTYFFNQLSNSSALFNHTWELVGRSNHLREAHEFVESQEQKVAILSGRGGIGKSKILHAFAETFEQEHKEMALWFVAEGVTFTRDSADELPYKPCVIIVDDAHRREDLSDLLALTWQRPHATKFLLSCRPQGSGHLKSQLTQGGFDVQEVVGLPDVKELSRGEVIELGRQALGPEFAGFAERLAAATRDCPLVTVVGGQLLAKKAIDPELLERDEDFRYTVLSRFQEIRIGEFGEGIDTKLCKSLLKMIAAVQPLRLDNEQTLDRQAEFLKIDRPTLLEYLGILDEAGVLLQRGHTLRIVPDVLADHILHTASVTPQGQPTGYADLVFNEFASLCPGEVLRNLSELDWRLRQSGAQGSDLLNSIWQSIGRAFREASNQGRCMILDILEKVAVTQPERTLELVEYAIRNPTAKQESPEWAQLYQYSHSDVLHQLPSLLRQVSYTPAFLPRCCNLLWELGRDNDRRLNSSPAHAMSVLAGLGGYAIEKPYDVTSVVMDAIEKLLEDPGSHNHIHSPLDIIDPMLAKKGRSGHFDRHNFVSRLFKLKYESVKPIRQRAISLVGSCLFSTDLRISLRALESLERALREPIPDFNLEFSDEELEQWRPEQFEILRLIADLARRSTEPVTLIHIREVLWRYRSYTTADEGRDKVDAIVSSFPTSFELRLTQELMGPFRTDGWLLDEDNGDDDYELRQEKGETMRRALVIEFLDHSHHVGKAYEILAERIQTMNAAGVQPDPKMLLEILGTSAPEYADALCDLIVDNPKGPLAPYLQPLLTSVRIWSAERARDIGQRALRGGSDILCCGIAKSYQSRRWADNADTEDIEIIKELLDHEDIYTRGQAIRSLRALAESHPKDAIALAKGVEVGENVYLAKELCQLFSEGYGVPFQKLTSDDLKSLLSKLEDVLEIDDYFINTLLVKASEQDPRAILDLLLTRIRKEGEKEATYHPLPLLEFRDPLIGLAESPDQETILREIRDTSLEPGSSIAYWIPQLFREVSLDFESAAGLKVLNEWINSGDADRIKSSARLVSSAHPAFVFKHEGFTSNLLERAYAAGPDCYRSVVSNLTSSAISGTRSGTPGQPKSEDVAMRDQASEVMNQYDAGSPPYKFYASLVKFAETTIREDLMRDEELYG